MHTSLLPTFEIPIIPLFSVSTLQSTLFGFQRQLVVGRKSAASTPRSDSRITLLPYCSVNTPIPEHDRNVLSELYHSIPEVAQAATTREGQEALKEWLDGPLLAASVVGFWEEE